MRHWISPLLCLALAPFGCTQDLQWSAAHEMARAAGPNVPTLTTDSLANRLRDSTSAAPILLDARTSEEYAVSHLPGARRVDPDADAYPALDSLSADAPIVVYCSVGVRSAKVAARLREQGYTNVSNLKGSIFQWANEGRSVVRSGQPVQAVHPYDATWGRLLNDSLHAYAP